MKNFLVQNDPARTIPRILADGDGMGRPGRGGGRGGRG